MVPGIYTVAALFTVLAAIDVPISSVLSCAAMDCRILLYGVISIGMIVSVVFLFMSHNMLKVFLLMIIEGGGNSEQKGISCSGRK